MSPIALGESNSARMLSFLKYGPINGFLVAKSLTKNFLNPKSKVNDSICGAARSPEAIEIVGQSSVFIKS